MLLWLCWWWCYLLETHTTPRAQFKLFWFLDPLLWIMLKFKFIDLNCTEEGSKYSQSVCSFLVHLLPTGGGAEGPAVEQGRSGVMHDYLTRRPRLVLGSISARARPHPPSLPRDLWRGKLGDASSCFVCPATGGCRSPEMCQPMSSSFQQL